MTPFFSVIIPLYNKGIFIDNTIKSVLNQTFQDFEIIIVDDGSTDNSIEIVSAYKSDKIKLFKQPNQGVSVARNNGVNNAKAKYIALLDADDYWYKNHLSELKKQIDLFPEAGLFCNNYEVYYTTKYKRSAHFNFEYHEDCLLVKDFFKASIVNCLAWTSAVAFSKEKFNAIGGFDPYLKTTQDLDLWIRMALKHKVSFNPKTTMSYKLYVDDSLSKNEFNTIRYNFNNKFLVEEKTNASLKLYLDKNRYALALRCKINNDYKIYDKLKKEINYHNLNFKQRIILKLPKRLLKLIKSFQIFLIRNNTYITAYK